MNKKGLYIVIVSLFTLCITGCSFNEKKYECISKSHELNMDTHMCSYKESETDEGGYIEYSCPGDEVFNFVYNEGNNACEYTVNMNYEEFKNSLLVDASNKFTKEICYRPNETDSHSQNMKECVKSTVTTVVEKSIDDKTHIIIIPPITKGICKEGFEAVISEDAINDNKSGIYKYGITCTKNIVHEYEALEN